MKPEAYEATKELEATQEMELAQKLYNEDGWQGDVADTPLLEVYLDMAYEVIKNC